MERQTASDLTTPEAVLDRILESRTVESDDGRTWNLRGNINRSEVNFLRGLIAADRSIARTAEIGCAFGIAALAICGATAGRDGARHLIIDPFQSGMWSGMGITHLRRAGLHQFELVERGSEFELPRRAETEAGTFDLIFVDGFHTFDHTMIDMFFANRLLRVGGLLVVDDCTLPSVSRAISYFRRYPCYEFAGESRPDRPRARHRLAWASRALVPDGVRPVLPRFLHDLLERARYGSMVALRKIDEDRRMWNWYPTW